MEKQCKICGRNIEKLDNYRLYCSECALIMQRKHKREWSLRIKIK